MKILVTGGRGFIGAHAVRQLASHHQVLAPDRCDLDLLDARSTAAFLKRHRPDGVLHAATWNATRTSEKDLSRVLECNLRMYFNLLDARSSYGRLVHYGSGAEFDRRCWRTGMRETDFGAVVPIDDYGFSKFLIERGRPKDGSTCNLRLFGVFGPGEDWRIRFLSQACLLALHDRPIVIRQDRLFDYTWVEDVARATQLVLEGQPLVESINLSAGRPERLSAWAQRILRVAGKDLPVHILEAGEGAGYGADTRKWRERHPSFVFTDPDEALTRLLDHFRSALESFPLDRLLI